MLTHVLEQPGVTEHILGGCALSRVVSQHGQQEVGNLVSLSPWYGVLVDEDIFKLPEFELCRRSQQVKT